MGWFVYGAVMCVLFGGVLASCARDLQYLQVWRGISGCW